jgi:glycosyltransferase involved in cell wall biosynthesis
MNPTASQSGKPSICLVAHFAYGAMSGGAAGHIGGVERQTTLMARWFVAQGYPVSLLTWDEGQADAVVIDGVRVIKMCRREAGIPGLRFLHPRWTSLNRALRRADAEVYYHNCGEYVTGQVALWCRFHGRRFVYSVANDPGVDPRLPDLPKMREQLLYRYGLCHADRVIVQTRSQQRMLRDGFGLDSVVIPMPCPSFTVEEYHPPRPPGSESAHILWIGRVCRQKRPDRLLALAERCPHLRFDMVGPPGEDDYSRQVLEEAGGVGNVTIYGGVPRAGLSEFYRRAACLCCTSDYEGFPNTFLEAWSYGLPVVSTFDPDGLIVSMGMGVSAAGVDELAAGLCGLLISPERWREASANARQYYLDNHTMERTMPLFERVFIDVCRGNRAATVKQAEPQHVPALDEWSGSADES